MTIKLICVFEGAHGGQRGKNVKKTFFLGKCRDNKTIESAHFVVENFCCHCAGSYFWRVPPCAVKTCAVRPVLARVVWGFQGADPSKCPRAHETKC